MFEAALPQLYLFGTGLAAGTLNVLAGGGSAITVPLLIFLGLPATVANGTNRIAILAQNLAAVASFRRHGYFEGRWLVFGAPPAIVGAIVGTWVAIVIGDAAFQRVLAASMVLVALWILWRPLKAPPEGGAEGPPDATGAKALLAIGFFGVGFYGGFIQAGVGFLILAVTTAAGLDLVRGNALKMLLSLAFTPLSLVLFYLGGKVEWIPGLVLAAGMVAGSFIGVRMAVLKGHDWIRKVVTVVVVLFAVRLWWTA